MGTDDKTNILGKNLLELRQARDINQEEVATAIGITPGAYSSWERGRTQPSIQDLLKLARYFGVSVDRLLRFDSRTLKIGSWVPVFGNFHPIKNPAGFFFMLYALVFNQLYNFDIHKKRYNVELIDAWGENVAGNSYYFTIKKDVKFHSGEPLTLDDIKLSYDLYIELNDSYYNFIENVNIIENRHEIEVQMKPGKRLELYELPTPYIIPRSYVRADSDECFDGTGPFTLTDAVQQERIREHLKQPVRLDSNNAYFGKIASIRSVEFQYIREKNELEAKLNNGEIDLAYEVNPKLVDIGRFIIEYGQGTVAYFLVFTQRSALCRDDNFRKAIDFAINRQDIVNSVGVEERDLKPARHLYLVLGDAPFEKEINPYNEIEAKALWEKALVSLKRNGIDDFTVKVGTSFDDPILADLAREVINQLKKIGIEAKEEKWEDADILVQPIEFQRINMVYYNLHSNDEPSIPIPWVYRNSYMDQLLDGYNGVETYEKIQELLSAEKIFLPLFRKGISVAYTNELSVNHRIQATNIPYGNDMIYWEFSS